MFDILWMDRPSFSIDELCRQPIGNGFRNLNQAFQDQSNRKSRG
jgi:hypothetical protein